MTKQNNRIGIWALAAAAVCSTAIQAQETDTTVVRIAELVIDPEQLVAYSGRQGRDGRLDTAGAGSDGYLFSC